MLATPMFLQGVNTILANTIQVKYLGTPGGVETFYALYQDGAVVTLEMPSWECVEWHRDDGTTEFGGWLISHGGTVRYVRPRLSHTGLLPALQQVLALKELILDVRIPEVRTLIKTMLEPEGFYFQPFDLQLAEHVAGVLLTLNPGSSKIAQDRAATKVKREVNTWLQAFPQCNRRQSVEDDAILRFLQSTIRVGYPEGPEVPAGVDAFFRDVMVEWLGQQKSFLNPWGEGPFTACVACTGKTVAGEWVTVCAPDVVRHTPYGPTLVERMAVPSMMAAQFPVGYNPKRLFREGNALRTAWPLHKPKPLTHVLKNGFEHLLGPYLDSRRTEVCVMFAGIRGVNLYELLAQDQDPDAKEEELLNLDDILKTQDGFQTLKTTFRREWNFSGEEFLRFGHEFLEGSELKRGHSLHTTLGYQTTVGGHDTYQSDVTVLGPEGPDHAFVNKVLIGDLKAMAKRVINRVTAVDRAGHKHVVDLVVSGHSIAEKKVPHLPLAAVAGRAGIRYWEDYTHAIDAKRVACQPTESIAQWVDQYDDLVKATYHALLDQNEDPWGLVDIFVQRPDPSDPQHWTTPEFIGQATVGYLPAAVLWENEQSGTKARSRQAVPYAQFLRHLAKKPLRLDEETRGLLNQMIGLYGQLEPFEAGYENAGFGSSEPDYNLLA